MLSQPLRSVSSVAATLILSSCGDLTGLDFLSTRLTSISIGAEQGPIVEVGDTIRLTATGNVEGIAALFSYAPILDAVWATSDAAIARIEPLPPPPPNDSFPSARTLVRGVRPGTARITASHSGITGEVSVRVIPVLATIRLSAPNTIIVGDRVRIAAVALEPDGNAVSDVPLTFAAAGGVRLNGYDRTGASLIVTAAGPASLSVRFRRLTSSVSFAVAAK